MLRKSRMEVREKYIEITPSLTNSNIIDIEVSFDASWHRCEHKSLYGVTCVIDVQTGYMIDYDILPKYCSCEKNKDLNVGTLEYNLWPQDHMSQCETNYSGSSPAMEMKAALTFWH